MGTAIVGLVGVIVGGVLTGAVSYVMERRSEMRAVRAAARLIEMGYREVPPYLDRMQASGTYVPPARQAEYSYNIWLQYYRDKLASTLSVSDWNATQEGMAVLERLLEWGETGPPHGLDMGWLGDAAEAARRAHDAWTHLANRRAGRNG